jgi:hypothetical protein
MRSWVPPRRRTVGDKVAETSAVTGDEPIERIDERGRTEDLQQPAEPECQPELDEERHASAPIARQRRPVAKDEPPALTARLLGDGVEQTGGLVVGQRQQRKAFVSVELGNDPRCTAAESSPARVQHHRARQHVDGRGSAAWRVHLDRLRGGYSVRVSALRRAATT